ncbi:hypothetical protein Vretimale_12169, partial [Volvox reticuliferus]
MSAQIEPSPSLPRLELQKALVPSAEHSHEQSLEIGVHLRDRLRNQILRHRTQISAPSCPSDAQPHHPRLPISDVSEADPKPFDTNQHTVQDRSRQLRPRSLVAENPADANDVAASDADAVVAVAATAVPTAVTLAAAAAMEEAASAPSPLLQPPQTRPHRVIRRSERVSAGGTAAAAAAAACSAGERRGRRRQRTGPAAVAVGAPVAGTVPVAEAVARQPLQLHAGAQRGVQGGPDDTQQTDPRVSLWIPPASPWGLIEEALYDNPWRLLVACILLNRTTGRQVRQVLGPLWRVYPTAEAMAAADPRVVQDIVRPLGLHAVRAARLVRFSQEFMSKQWTNPSELHGVGRYGEEAYFIFCRGRWREVQPEDKDLRRYLDWLESTGGEGSGLEREDLAAVLQGGCEKDEEESEEKGCRQQPQQ